MHYIGCKNYEPNAASKTMTYNKAGVTALAVGSNKTLLGKGSNAGMYVWISSAIYL